MFLNVSGLWALDCLDIRQLKWPALRLYSHLKQQGESPYSKRLNRVFCLQIYSAFGRRLPPFCFYQFTLISQLRC